jgi:uncharacterized membrane protein
VITLYEVLLFLHIVGVAVWLGAEAATLGLRVLTLRSGDLARAVALVADTEKLNRLVIGPATVLVLGSGLWLVEEGDWGFGRFFVIFGLAGWVASSAFVGLFTMPAGKRLDQAAESDGPDSPTVRSLFRRVQLGVALDAALIVSIAFVMVTKPTI